MDTAELVAELKVAAKPVAVCARLADPEVARLAPWKTSREDIEDC